MQEHFYDKIYADKDYERESLAVTKIIKEINPSSRTLLDVCCGTGKHLSFLQSQFECSGVDINEKMIQTAKSRVKCDLYIDDMRNFLINKKFDIIICLFGSIAYNLSYKDLNKTIKNFKRHLKEKGSILIEPFVFKKNLNTGFYQRKVGDIQIESNVSKQEDVCVLEKKYYFPSEIIEKTYKLYLYEDEEYTTALEKNNFKVQKKSFPEGNFQFLYIGQKND